VALKFPGSLTATSIRGITSTISAMLCASAVGNWIDRSPSRLSTMVITINLSHFAIIASYIVWLYLPSEGIKSEESGLPKGPFSSFTLGLLYGATLLLDIVHDLNGIANRLSVERDWVPVLVGPITADMKYGLTQVNSVVRRIDLIVSLVSPSLVPLVMASFGSRTGWLLFLACMTGVLWVMEIWLVRHVSSENPEIRAPKKSSGGMQRPGRYGRVETNESWSQQLYHTLYLDPAKRMRQYFSIPMWPASISTALLELTVLAYSATLITYLIEIGFTVTSITIARATGTALGLSSTVITPWAVNYLKKRNSEASRQEDEDDGGEGKAVRTVGMWGISEQFICMVSLKFLAIIYYLTKLDSRRSSPLGHVYSVKTYRRHQYSHRIATHYPTSHSFRLSFPFPYWTLHDWTHGARTRPS
jgi:iron-regulated transporter 1